MQQLRAPFRDLAIKQDGDIRKKRVFLPSMSDHAHAVAASFRACGVEAEVLPAIGPGNRADRQGVQLGKGMLPAGSDDGRHGQGNAQTRISIRTGAPFSCRPGRGPAGSDNITAITGRCSIVSGSGRWRSSRRCRMNRFIMMSGCSDKNFVLMCWRGALAIDMLQKALWEHRPHEKERAPVTGYMMLRLPGSPPPSRPGPIFFPC